MFPITASRPKFPPLVIKTGGGALPPPSSPPLFRRNVARREYLGIIRPTRDETEDRPPILILREFYNRETRSANMHAESFSLSLALSLSLSLVIFRFSISRSFRVHVHACVGVFLFRGICRSSERNLAGRERKVSGEREGGRGTISGRNNAR